MLEIRRAKRVGRSELWFSWRSAKNLWGRFGGGWNWRVGFQAGGGTLIVHLLICEVGFSFRRFRA